MRKNELTIAYLRKAEVRIKALHFYLHEGSYSDVVRDAQVVVELLLKAVLRSIGIEAPKIHDVGKILAAHQDRLPKSITTNLTRIKMISKRLRKERELSLYGAEDFVPTEEYDMEDALQAIEEAEFVFRRVKEGLEETQT